MEKQTKIDHFSRTEFPRFEPDGGGGSVSTFFNKLLSLPGVFSASEAATAPAPSEPPPATERPGPADGAEEAVPAAGEGRSLHNVLRRISSLVALGSQGAGGGGARYADTELARYWMPDDISRECLECEAKFSALRRRHHCRVCGQIFCSRCCSQRVPGEICGCAGGLRVCTYCCRVVLSYLQEREVSADLRSLQESLQVKFPERASQPRLRDSFMLARSPEERGERAGGAGADSPPRSPPRSPRRALRDVYRHLAYALPTQQHRYRLVRYSGVWRGCDIMQWIIDNTSNTTRSQASAVCQALLAAGYMECATEQLKFADYALYRPVALSDTQPDNEAGSGAAEVGGAAERARLAESVSSYCLDLNLGDTTVRVSKAPERREPGGFESGGGCSGSEEEAEAPGEPAAAPLCPAVAEAGREHLALLARQCLAREALPQAWAPVLLALCRRAADAVTPDLYGRQQDVRTYVQVKRAAGGAPGDSCLLSGVVLSKHVAHRGMPRRLVAPAVLLLDCSVAYQRQEGKLTSLEPLLMQEHEYLLRCARRVLALRPGVVLARGAVARTVQDELREAGVALATGVRERALDRAARCLRADRVTSIDSLIGTPRLGTCASFYVKNYEGKALMVLEGCAEARLGCCVLLRGAGAELARAKRVARLLLLACYNWRLERAYLADVAAALPPDDIAFAPPADPPPPGDPPPPAGAAKSAEAKASTGAEAPEDVPHSRAPPRKADGDKTLSCGVLVRDFSDPLRARADAANHAAAADDDVFLPSERLSLTADAAGDRWWTEEVALSLSPHVKMSAPYLETEAGRRCPLRRHFPSPLFAPRAPRAAPAAPPARHARTPPPRARRTLHPFAARALAAGADDAAVRAALALYRATGGAAPAHAHAPWCPARSERSAAAAGEAAAGAAEERAEGTAAAAEADPLSPEQHQRLHLLTYSYSSKSANVPDFCVNPWIIQMDMYGHHDISLGAFLDKFCFNMEYRCPSRTCHAPMLHHIRRFVHGDGCITITCNSVGNSTNLDKATPNSKQVRWWSRCGACGEAGAAGAAAGAARVSRGTLALSLAKYLELRLHAARYTRAPCAHSLHHAHAHYFARGPTTACFRYNKIKLWDIVLPLSTIRTQHDPRAVRDALLQQTNELLLKGHEVFSAAGACGAGESGGGACEAAERDFAAFKQHLEQVHVALTSAALHQQQTHAGVVRWLWGVSDRLVAGERLVREAQERYAAAPSAPAPAAAPAPPTNKLLRALHDASAEEKSDIEDSANDWTNTESSDAASKSDVEHTGGEEEEERGDRKTVRAILTQLLSASQPANQGGIIISGGVVPVVVQAGEIGSVIAAGLASVQYQQQLQQLLLHQPPPSVSESEDTECKERGEGEARSKPSAAAKSADHVEVLLKDGLLCRVYYAAQFQKLRALLLAPLDHAPLADGDSFAPATTSATAVTSTTTTAASTACSAATAADATDKADGAAHGHRRTGSGRAPAAPQAGAAGALCEVEEGFLRSLARCVPWTARGGKSGSTFCKTVDDRYVLKEMSKQEWQQFLEFAPHYFHHVVSCHQHQLPSLLARIVGVYSVGGAGNGVLVMENLFYGHPDLAQRFDLKGASRNRLAADTAAPDAVLMDENLLNMRWETALHVRAHTAEVLWAALERDTAFLASHSVMDYSLLLGVEPQHNRLVLGVIDYIRTFTWDKKLEHLVKKNLGSGQPTIVSPAQYRQRFLTAARKYFLHAPTQWAGLQRPLPAPPAPAAAAASAAAAAPAAD